jgi:hypothetical protein
MNRLLASYLVIVCSLAGSVMAQGPDQMPAGPSVPIGCLLSPKCGDDLLVPSGFKPLASTGVPLQKPNNPGGIACLVKKDCSINLYVNQVTLNDVAASGAAVGDFVVTKARVASTMAAPAGPPPTANEQAASARCTDAVGILDRTSRSARAAPLASRHPALDDLVVAYEAAVDACAPLAP